MTTLAHLGRVARVKLLPPDFDVEDQQQVMLDIERRYCTCGATPCPHSADDAPEWWE